MIFTQYSDEVLKQFIKEIQSILWKRDKEDKHEVYWIRYPYAEETDHIITPAKTLYLTPEEAHQEALVYMNEKYGEGNYEIETLGRCIRSRAYRKRVGEWSNVMDTTLRSKWVDDDE